MHFAEIASATERLVAFENRYKGRHADEHALDCGLDERELHERRVDETYRDFEENTRKAFDHSCREWVVFCKKKAYSMFDTNAKTGAAFLQYERQRLPNSGKRVEVYLNHFKKLCTIRGCPDFSKNETIYMHNVVTKARKTSAQAARSRPADENKKQMDRSIISSADLEELLTVCASMPDRVAAARATALIKTSRLTGELTSTTL